MFKSYQAQMERGLVYQKINQRKIYELKSREKFGKYLEEEMCEHGLKVRYVQ